MNSSRRPIGYKWFASNQNIKVNFTISIYLDFIEIYHYLI